LATGRVVARQPLPFADDTPRTLLFRPDGKAVALLLHRSVPTLSRSGPILIHLWEESRAWQGRTLLELSGNAKAPRDVGALAFSADGHRLAVVYRQQAWICDPATGQLLHTLPGHGERSRDLCFSADGQRLFVGSNVGSQPEIKVWDVDTGRALLTLYAEASDESYHRLLYLDRGRLFVPSWNREDGLVEVQLLDGTPVRAGSGR
jgi:WD40 repeat protein